MKVNRKPKKYKNGVTKTTAVRKAYKLLYRQFLNSIVTQRCPHCTSTN